MKIILAKTAGFCFGVDNAINTINKLIETGVCNIHTLGPIIHNDQVVSSLMSKGVKVANDAEDLHTNGTVVIRAHGVTPKVHSQLEAKDLNIVDATCPYVKKIHLLVKKKHTEGFQIIIVGDKAHPEVKGIDGWADNKAYIVNDTIDVERITNTSKPFCVVAQTTITHERWVTINNLLEKRFENIQKFDTICSATSQRQREASEIAKTVDMMIVIGSKNSSNTQKLYEICTKYCSGTVKIESPDELPLETLKKCDKIGITAGASTPDCIIKEVIEKMEELNKTENEMSFKDAFESSLVILRTGETVKGKIIGFNHNEVFVDLGYKSDGIIPLEEFSDDPDFKPESSITVGDEINVFVVRVNDGEGNVLLSKRKVDAVKNWDKLAEAYESKTPVKAKILEVVNGGVISIAGGVKIFIPASQVSNRYVKDLKEFVNQVVSLRIIEYNKQKRKFVGSCRIILEEEKSRVETEFWSVLETGKGFEGTVKSFTDFGAFVDIGGVDGLIHISELAWNKVKHPSEVLKAGQKVDVTILEFDKSKKRISLGYRKPEDNPWHKAEEKYNVGDVVKGTVARLVPFGAFVELEKGLDALVHISQISNTRIAKPGDVLEVGQEVEARVIEVNVEAKRVSLSIKDVKPIDPFVEAQPDNDEAAPSEYREESPNLIGDIAAIEMNDETQTDEA